MNPLQWELQLVPFVFVEVHPYMQYEWILHFLVKCFFTVTCFRCFLGGGGVTVEPGYKDTVVLQQHL